MNKYRVWAYEKVPYYLDLKATNKTEAHQKSHDANRMDWIEGETYGLWDKDSGFKIKKNMIEKIEDV
jgi:hypothetical protein